MVDALLRCAKNMKIHLTEASAWTGYLFDLKIESGVATFAGSDIYQGRFPDTMSLRPETIEQIEGALILLAVFDWRELYRPEDIGSVVDDGGSWSLDASVGGMTVHSTGFNASPSFRSPSTTTIHEERYGLLREAIFAALRFSVPFSFRPKNQEAQQAAP